MEYLTLLIVIVLIFILIFSDSPESVLMLFCYTFVVLLIGYCFGEMGKEKMTEKTAEKKSQKNESVPGREIGEELLNKSSKLYEKVEPEFRTSYDISNAPPIGTNQVYANADDQFTSKGKDMGSRAKESIDIRSTYDADSIRGYFRDELDSTEKRIWWEDNDALQQFM